MKWLCEGGKTAGETMDGLGETAPEGFWRTGTRLWDEGVKKAHEKKSCELEKDRKGCETTSFVIFVDPHIAKF